MSAPNRSSQRLPGSHPRNRERERPQRRGGRGATPSQRTGSRNIPGWLWLVAGLGAGMLITSLIHLGTAPMPETPTDPAQKRAQIALTKPAVKREVAEKAPAPKEEPGREAKAEPEKRDAETAVPATRFDFYTLLPEREVIVPERETAEPVKPATVAAAAPTPAATAPAAAPVAQSGADSYLLQAGSFRGSADAERRRTQIAALGLQARIETVRAGSDTWYRVHAGPFTSRDQLGNARERLSAEGIETLQIRQK